MFELNDDLNNANNFYMQSLNIDPNFNLSINALLRIRCQKKLVLFFFFLLIKLKIFFYFYRKKMIC